MTFSIAREAAAAGARQKIDTFPDHPIAKSGIAEDPRAHELRHPFAADGPFIDLAHRVLDEQLPGLDLRCHFAELQMRGRGLRTPPITW